MLAAVLEVAVDLMAGLQPVDDLRFLDDDPLACDLGSVCDYGDTVVEPPEILAGAGLERLADGVVHRSGPCVVTHVRFEQFQS